TDDITVLTYGIPVEGELYGPIFDVYDALGNPVPYIGKLARRVWPPSDDAYMRVKALQTLSYEIDITDDYAFSGAGDYIIQFAPPQQFAAGVSFAPSNNVIGRLPLINRRMS